MAAIPTLKMNSIREAIILFPGLYYSLYTHTLLLFLKSKTRELKSGSKAILIAMYFKHRSLFDVVFILTERDLPVSPGPPTNIL